MVLGQEIYDYIYERLDALREPDVRIAVKAYNRKVQNLPFLPWQEVIDNYLDDDIGLAVRQIMRDTTLKTTQEKVEVFRAITGKDRATYYRETRHSGIHADLQACPHPTDQQDAAQGESTCGRCHSRPAGRLNFVRQCDRVASHCRTKSNMAHWSLI